MPSGVKSYLGIHLYTLTQILVTVIIFIVSLTKGAPAFPIIIIVFVPIRLLVMNKIWGRSTLRIVDAWACRPGRPEDESTDERGGGDVTMAGNDDSEKLGQERVVDGRNLNADKV